MASSSAPWLFAALLAVAAPMASGCFVEEAPPPGYAYGYQPQLYYGYVVYFDDYGRPYYYYSDGVAYWVPVGSPYYGGLVAHYRVHHVAYHAWFVHYGHGWGGGFHGGGFHGGHGHGKH